MGFLIAAVDLKTLPGETFHFKPVGTKVRGTIPFNISQQPINWPRGGTEAYAMLGECDHPQRGKVSSVLKLFKLDVPERRERSRFLIAHGLAKHHPWLFHGVPYAAIAGLKVQNVQLVGHVAHRIAGDDIARLRVNGIWNYSLDERRRMAGHLCCAVAALERLGIVHGDLSSRNVIVSSDEKGNPAAVLCDFDGFHHSSQPNLPRMFQNMPCRPLGSPGYQYPALVLALANDDSDPQLHVETDRFALAALVCEIVSWTVVDATVQQRAELLGQDVLATSDLSSMPQEILSRWPQGFALLQKALSAPSPAAMPSPLNWLKALGVPLGLDMLSPPQPFVGRPIVVVQTHVGTHLGKPFTARLANPTGTFGALRPELNDVAFHAPPQALTLAMGWKTPVFLERGSDRHDLGSGPHDLPLQPGDVVISNSWRFQVFDDQSDDGKRILSS